MTLRLIVQMTNSIMPLCSSLKKIKSELLFIDCLFSYIQNTLCPYLFHFSVSNMQGKKYPPVDEDELKKVLAQKLLIWLCDDESSVLTYLDYYCRDEKLENLNRKTIHITLKEIPNQKYLRSAEFTGVFRTKNVELH